MYFFQYNNLIIWPIFYFHLNLFLFSKKEFFWFLNNFILRSFELLKMIDSFRKKCIVYYGIVALMECIRIYCRNNHNVSLPSCTILVKFPYYKMIVYWRQGDRYYYVIISGIFSKTNKINTLTLVFLGKCAIFF